jgi:hypothetical protein
MASPTQEKVFGRNRTVATAEGKLADAAGKLSAHVTLTCTMFPLGGTELGLTAERRAGEKVNIDLFGSVSAR